jgi:ubiquinone/menaquinone biosynthesis C-methylase UbiE
MESKVSVRADEDTSNHDHPVFATVYDTCMFGFEATVLPSYRKHLSRGLSGRVLDLGSGTGAMFSYYRDAIEEGADVELRGIEPDSYMRKRAERVATELELDIELHDAPAEGLPFPDDSFDVVVAALVFCTVDDPPTALDEIARVLVPGGELRFIEHVADEGWRRHVQTVVTSVWKRVLFSGCHLDRDTPALFEAHDGFEVVELDRIHELVTPLRVMARGTLRRRSATDEDPGNERPRRSDPRDGALGQ